MKGMFKRALAGVAAAALAVTGLALGAGAANAAGMTGEQTITLNATDKQQLEGRTFAVYKLADYVQYGEEPNVVYGVQTVEGIEDVVRAAVNDAVDPNVAGDADPLAEVISRESNEGALSQDTDAPYSGVTRNFVNNLDKAELGSPVDVTASGVTGSDEAGYVMTLTVPDPGIYIIYDVTNPAKNNAIPMLVGTAPVYEQTEVNMKNQTVPDKPGKTVTGDTKGTVTIGDELTYTVTGTMPDTVNYETYTYVFTDTPSQGLTVNREGMTINGKQIGSGAGQVNAIVSFDATFDGDGNTPFTVTLDKDALAQVGVKAGQEFKLVYTATVNANAPASGVSNKVTVNNNGVVSGEGETPKLHYNDFTFNKHYADGTPAPNAEFVIKKADSYMTYTDGVWAALTGDANTKENATKFTPSNGVVSVHGLENGTYTVEEFKAADGAQNMLPSFTVTLEHGKDPVFADANDPWDLFDPTTATVTNVKSLTELPLTGAAGTALFTVLGLLIAGVGVTVYMKSRSVKHMLRG
ncbi:isopeptide-forming domain-containing fimbrial protein [uncultured Bifidobacterium sp.]|uniref:isopeptide-forming domain-containing fimbrial protein n=1 Tax=uncultured Bifidobacterium sp. TaxID=165187 RepID=UPI00258AFAAB|nr:isopeptide-forming domain-containing fimbrial protein [uncultured Bifidobacterium sp.]